MNEPRPNRSSKRDRKLISLLRSFSPAEFRSFEQFLYSPFFDISPNAVELFAELKLAFPYFEEKMPADEALFKAVFPGKTFENRKLNKTFHQLLEAARSFLSHTELRRNKFLLQQMATRNTRNWDDPTHFENTSEALLLALEVHLEGSSENGGIGDLTKALSQTDLHEASHLQFSLLSNLYLHPNTEKFKADVELLPKTVAALDRHFLRWRLYFACELESRRQFLGETNTLPFQAEVEVFARQDFVKKDVVMQLYLALLELFRNKADHKLFLSSKSLFTDNLLRLDKQQGQILLFFFVNYATRIFKEGDKEYIHQIHDLFQLGLKAKLLTQNGLIADGTFINVVNAAALSGNFGDGHRFIENYQEFLRPNKQTATVKLCQAFIFFHQGDFLNAHKYARLVDLAAISLRHALIARPLLLRCQFEVWLQEGLASHSHILHGMDAFRRYLDRSNELSDKHKGHYFNFIFVLRKMIKYIAAGSLSPNAKKRLLQKVKAAPPPIAQNWLEGKIEQLL